MDRRLLFPAIAVSALAQQTSPANAEAEKALRAHVDQFYQLEINKDFRHAESLVAEDSKDYFYNANKPNFQSFSGTSIELTDHGTRAKVTVKVKTEVFFPGVGAQVFETPAVSNWKLENGEWVWYFDKDAALNTPFGRMNPNSGGATGTGNGINTLGKAPDLATLETQVSISRTVVALTEEEPLQTVTISNSLPGSIGLEVAATPMEGVTVELEKNELKAGEVGGIRFRLKGSIKTSGTVRIVCTPVGQRFEIKVTAN